MNRPPLMALPEDRPVWEADYPPYTKTQLLRIIVGSFILAAVICGLMFLFALADVPVR